MATGHLKLQLPSSLAWNAQSFILSSSNPRQLTGISWQRINDKQKVPDDERTVEAKPGTFRQVTDPSQLPLQLREALVRRATATHKHIYEKIWALGPLVTGRKARGNYNVAKDDTTLCVLCYNPCTFAPTMFDDLATTIMWVSDEPLQLQEADLTLLAPHMADILRKLQLKQDDLKNFRWHHVDPFHFDDNKFYGPALNIPFNGQLVEAGSVFPLDSLLAALLGDFGQLLAGDMQLLNFTNEQRAEVLQVLQRLYPAVGADGMVLFQAAKIRDPKKNAAFLQLMRTAGESNNVPELKAWALPVLQQLK